MVTEAFAPGRPAPARFPALRSILTGALLLVGALAVLAPANPAVRAPDRDSGFYLYIGDQILHGRLPYRDAWDHKPPAIYYLNAAGLWMGRGSRWGVWLLELAALLAAAGAAFRLMRRLWGAPPALLGLLLLLAGFRRTFEGGNLTEEYPLLLHFIAIALLPGLAHHPRRRMGNLGLGLLLAGALLFRPNNAVVEVTVVLALAAARMQDRDLRGLLRQAAWIGLGLLTPLAATALFFRSQGALGDLFDAAVLYNLAYSATGITGGSTLQGALRAFGPLMLVVAALGYAAAALRLRREAGSRPLLLFLLLGLPLAALLSDPARRGYLHYYMNWLPFIALLGGLALHTALDGRLRLIQAAAAAPAWTGLGLAAALVFAAGSGAASDLRSALTLFARRGETGVEYVPAVVEYVAEHTRPGDTVLFWGAYPGDDFLAGRQAPSGALFYPLYVPSPVTEALDRRFLAELQAGPPALIVDMNEPAALSLDPAERRRQVAAGEGWSYLPANLPQFFDLLAQDYRYAGRAGGHAIYARRPGP